MGIAQAEMGRARTFTPSFAGLRRPADTLRTTLATIALKRPHIPVIPTLGQAQEQHPQKTPEETLIEQQDALNHYFTTGKDPHGIREQIAEPIREYVPGFPETVFQQTMKKPGEILPQKAA